MRALWERRDERVLEAFEAGVRIYAGTDAGSVIRHGRIADEILALHAAGLPRGRGAGRRLLGRPGRGWERTASPKAPAPTSCLRGRTRGATWHHRGTQARRAAGEWSADGKPPPH